jgi:hypothetical protein
MRPLQLAVLATVALSSPVLAQKGDPSRGQHDFRVCASNPITT